MNIKLKRVIISFIMTAALILLNSTATFAQASSPTDDFGLRFTPDESTQKGLGYYNVDLKGGDSYTFEFNVTNITDAAKSFRIYPSDVLTGIKGGMEARKYSDIQTAVGSWFQESPQHVSLKGNTSRKFTFHIKIPKSIQSGQYIGGIVVQPETSASFGTNFETSDGQEASLTTKIENRMLIQTVINIDKANSIVNLSLPNPRYGYEQDGRFFINLTFNNTGTILLRPSGIVSLFDSNHNLIETNPYSMIRVYGGTTGIFPYYPSNFLRQGQYLLEYNAKFLDKNIRKSFRFSISNKESAASQSALINNLKMVEPVPKVNSKSVFILCGAIFLLAVVSTFLLFLITRKNKSKNYKS